MCSSNDSIFLFYLLKSSYSKVNEYAMVTIINIAVLLEIVAGNKSLRGVSLRVGESVSVRCLFFRESLFINPGQHIRETRDVCADGLYSMLSFFFFL